MLAGICFLFVAIGLVSARPPQTLHERTCYGLWMNTVHLHGHCFVDVSNRANKSEVDRLFETENEQFDEVQFAQVPYLIRLRALQEHAMKKQTPATLYINRDRQYVEQSRGCSKGFVAFNGKCYTATKREVTYNEAVRECGVIHGKLVGGPPEVPGQGPLLEFLYDLVKYYIKVDVFTAYVQLDDNENEVRDPLQDAHVEIDYETDRLQYVHKNQKRAFICEVNANVASQPLFRPVPLPVHEDGVISHDTSPLPPPAANIERYLVDLLQFRCPGNFSDKGAPKDDVIRQRVDLDDLDAHFPYGCHYERSLGNVVADLTNPRHMPKELKKACKSLLPLYRHFDKDQRVEYFGVHLPTKPSFGYEETHDVTDPIGFCAKRQGDCGASIPLYNPKSKRPELVERRPLRYLQVANRLVNIYSSKHLSPTDYTVQSDSAADSSSTEPKLLGSVISSLNHTALNDYCKQNLVPLYKIKNLQHPNEFLTINTEAVRRYRDERDIYSVEELLGYCATKPGYCGAALPLHHYVFRYPNEVRHDDAYFNVEQPVSEGVKHDILCYVF